MSTEGQCCAARESKIGCHKEHAVLDCAAYLAFTNSRMRWRRFCLDSIILSHNTGTKAPPTHARVTQFPLAAQSTIARLFPMSRDLNAISPS